MQKLCRIRNHSQLERHERNAPLEFFPRIPQEERPCEENNEVSPSAIPLAMSYLPSGPYTWRTVMVALAAQSRGVTLDEFDCSG
eukprot:4395899-Amphidinium_carterae.2